MDFTSYVETPDACFMDFISFWETPDACIIGFTSIGETPDACIMDFTSFWENKSLAEPNSAVLLFSAKAIVLLYI
jgi:hypothetical protein